MINLTPREKRLLIFMVVFIGVFSVIWWGVVPGWEEYNRVTKALNDVKFTYSQTQSVVRMEKDYSSRYEAYVAAYNTLKSGYYSQMGEKEATLKFLTLIEELTQESGITIISKTTGLNKEDGFKAMKVNLTLKGTADQLTDLLLAYQSAQTTVRVDRLRVDRDERNRLLQVKLTVSTLLIEEEGAAQ